MTLDPRLIELARQVERDLNPGRRDGALAPVRVLIAEYVYLERSPQHIFEFVKRAEIKISYRGMHMWLMRNFGRGKEAVRKAGLILQEAAEAGAYSSPYLPSRGLNAKSAQQARKPGQALEGVDGVAVQRQQAAGVLDTGHTPTESATESIAFSHVRKIPASPSGPAPEPALSSAVVPTKPSLLAVPGQAQEAEAPRTEFSPARISDQSATESIAFSHVRNSVSDPVASKVEPAQSSVGRSSTASVTDAEAEAKEAERIRIRDERVAKTRASAKRMLDANPFTRIANRQRMDERSDK